MAGVEVASDSRRNAVPIVSDTDIVVARQRGRDLAAAVGFQATDQTLIATVISELARNIVLYAKHGEIILEAAPESKGCGMIITARDKGPGIRDVDLAMEVGYSTSGGLGLGLPGVKRLVDEFEIVSQPQEGTIVKATKWRG